MYLSYEHDTMTIAALLSDCGSRHVGVARLLQLALTIDPTLKFRSHDQLTRFVSLIHQINSYATDIFVSASSANKFHAAVWLHIVDYNAGISANYPLISTETSANSARIGRQNMSARATIQSVTTRPTAASGKETFSRLQRDPISLYRDHSTRSQYG